MWKLTKNPMEQLDYVWPVANEGLATAEGDLDPFAHDGVLGWDEPLVGADVVDIQVPGNHGESGNRAETFPPISGFVDCVALVPPATTAKEDDMAVELCADEVRLIPMFEALQEWQDEVAKDLLDSLLDGAGDVVDPLKEDLCNDFDLDEFFREVANGSKASWADSARESDDEDEFPRMEVPSPALSSDSGIGSTVSLIPIRPLDFHNDDEISASKDEVDGTFQTIDFDALNFVHLDCDVVTTTTTTTTGEWEPSVVHEVVDEATMEEEEEEEDSEDTESYFDENNVSSSSSTSSPPKSCVDHFHPYAQKPAMEEENNGGRAKRKARKRAATNESRKSKKKEQNKTAAQRYRLKIKMEAGSVFQEEREEEKKNKELKSKVEGLEKEIEYLKNLMGEIKKQKKNRRK